MQMFSHGECNFFELSELPKNLKKVEIKENFFVVGESETHGNDHRVAVLDKENVQFFRDELERLYLKADVTTEIYCPKEARHDKVIINPGIYEINKAMEVDPLTQRLRQVAD